jgi:Uncharacterised nucleotidyltransferase
LRRTVTAEEELLLLLCGTAERRQRIGDRIVALARRADLDLLAALMARQLLFPLLGTRLVEAAPEQVTPTLKRRLDRALDLARRRGAQVELLALQLQADLDRAGILALPLKGTSLARNLYGDPGLRITQDIDILVGADDLDRAAGVLGHRGYRRSDGAYDNPGRLHLGLRHERSELPPVEVHWRIHWYENAFSRAMLERSEPAPEGRRARSADELAALLLFFSRDGLMGVRLAADVAAWWDAYGSSGGAPVLDQVCVEAPDLRDALSAAAVGLERLVGVRAEAIVPSRPARWRSRTAIRMANWTVTGNLDQIGANLTLVDWLLAPPGGGWSFVRRVLIPPSAQISAMYGLSPSAVWRRAFWRLAHCPKLLVRYLIALWKVRRGRSWTPVPASAWRSSTAR